MSKNTVEGLFSKLLAETAHLNEAKAVVSAKAAQLSDIREKIKDLLKLAQGTLGDDIKDFVFCWKGELEEEAIQGLRSLESMIEGRVGECILVVRRTTNYAHEDPGCFGGGYARGEMTEQFFTGILSSEKLECNLSEAIWRFPIDQFVGHLKGFDPFFYSEDEGVPLLPRDLYLHMDKVVSLHGGDIYRGKTLPAWEVVVGDKEVHAWFLNLYDLALEIKKETSTWKKKLFYVYKEHMEILGKPVLPIPDLLEDERKEKQELYGKILANVSKYFHQSSSDDSDPKEVEAIRTKVQEMLREALSKGMEREDYLVEIPALCKRFEVEMPVNEVA